MYAHIIAFHSCSKQRKGVKGVIGLSPFNPADTATRLLEHHQGVIRLLLANHRLTASSQPKRLPTVGGSSHLLLFKLQVFCGFEEPNGHNV